MINQPAHVHIDPGHQAESPASVSAASGGDLTVIQKTKRVVEPKISTAISEMTRARWKNLAILLVIIAVAIIIAVADAASAQEVAAVGSPAPSTIPAGRSSVADVAVESAPWLTLATLLVREGVSAFREWMKVKGADAEKATKEAESERSQRFASEKRLARAEAALEAAGFEEASSGRWTKPPDQSDPA